MFVRYFVPSLRVLSSGAEEDALWRLSLLPPGGGDAVVDKGKGSCGLCCSCCSCCRWWCPTWRSCWVDDDPIRTGAADVDAMSELLEAAALAAAAAAVAAAAAAATPGRDEEVSEEAGAAPGPPPEGAPSDDGSTGCPALRRILLMEETDGMELGSQARCATSCSRISQAKRAGFSAFTRRIRLTTDGVATCCWRTKQERKFIHVYRVFP